MKHASPTLHPGLREQASFHLAPVLGGVEMMHAAFRTQHFARHFHEEYAIGVIEAGAMAFRYRGENVVADAGSVNLVVPGEAHDGHAAGGPDAGWRYRMFYLRPALLREVAAQLAGRDHADATALPHFRPGVIHDAHLVRRVRAAHLALSTPGTPVLEQEGALLALLACWIVRHGEERPAPLRAGREPGAVRAARRHIQAHYSDDLCLADLAALAGLSPFHFLRVFERALGVTPHEYLTQTRIRRAKDLLSGPLRLADVAQEVGFADQSHLTRRFKRLLGVTPGAYRKIVQNNR